MKKYIALGIVLFLSFLIGFSEGFFYITAVAAFLLMPIALIKPKIALPFLKNISRKVAIPALAGAFLTSVMLSPTSTNNNQMQITIPSVASTASPQITEIPTEIPLPTKSVPTLIPTKVYIPPTQATQQTIIEDETDIQEPSYACNCSKTCPNMTCAEAYFQLNQCGCSERDGDDDGVPCEAQCR